MGYKQNKDGSWEQPVDAEKRVIRRSFVQGTLGSLAVAASFAGAAYGFALCTDSNTLTKDETNHSKLGGGLLLIVLGAVGSLGAVVPVARGIDRNQKSLDAIRADIRDGMVVVEGGRTLHPVSMLRNEP